MLYFLFNFDTERRVFFLKVLGEIWGGLGGLMAVLIPLLLEQAYCTTRGSFALRELPLGRRGKKERSEGGMLKSHSQEKIDQLSWPFLKPRCSRQLFLGRGRGMI